MGGIVDGLKWGIILNLGAVVILPVLTKFLGTHPGSGGGGRPFGFTDSSAVDPFSPPGSSRASYPKHVWQDVGSHSGGYGYFCDDGSGYCGGQEGGYEGGGGGYKKKKHKGHGGGYW